LISDCNRTKQTICITNTIMKLCTIYRFVTLLHYTVISGEHKELQMTNQP